MSLLATQPVVDRLKAVSPPDRQAQIEPRSDPAARIQLKAPRSDRADRAAILTCAGRERRAGGGRSVLPSVAPRAWRFTGEMMRVDARCRGTQGRDEARHRSPASAAPDGLTEGR